MYTVIVEHECACFKKSEYENNTTFETQTEAYHYANIVVELMNDEFCSRHLFRAQRYDGDTFLIRVAPNTTANAHITCDTGCDSTDTWTLEDTNTSKG
ncbi:MAG: hypothetical protein Q9M36_10375 [Sulfurovum sp.]|nr:hypothetical protein [Sulfurovum sp.]